MNLPVEVENLFKELIRLDQIEEAERRIGLMDEIIDSLGRGSYKMYTIIDLSDEKGCKSSKIIETSVQKNPIRKESYTYEELLCDDTMHSVVTVLKLHNLNEKEASNFMVLSKQQKRKYTLVVKV